LFRKFDCTVSRHVTFHSVDTSITNAANVGHNRQK
jgi:hypothetical protein